MIDLDLLKLKAYPAAGLLFMVFALLSGIMFIFTFDNNLFLKLNFIQLILLSVSGIAPILVFNLFLIKNNLNADSELKSIVEHNEIEKIYSILLLYSSIITMIAVYFPIILYAFNKMSYKIGFLVILILELLFFVYLYFDARAEKKRGKA